MLTTGVYTVACPRCQSQTLIHLISDGSINPHRCSKCEVEFDGIDSGEQRHSFVGLVKKEEEIEIVVNEEVEEETKETGEKSFVFSKTKGTDKKLLKRKKNQKNWQKIF